MKTAHFMLYSIFTYSLKGGRSLNVDEIKCYGPWRQHDLGIHDVLHTFAQECQEPVFLLVMWFALKNIHLISCDVSILFFKVYIGVSDLILTSLILWSNYVMI